MKLSSRVEYGTRALLELSFHFEDRCPLMLQSIAQKQSIPLKYLEQLFTKLRKAKLVKGFRGPTGGYQLTRHPSEIQLCEIVEALDGPLSVSKCLTDKKVKNDSPVAVQNVWQQLNQVIRQTLTGISLQDLSQRQKHHEAQSEVVGDHQCEPFVCEPVQAEPTCGVFRLNRLPSMPTRASVGTVETKKKVFKASQKASVSKVDLPSPTSLSLEK